MTKKPLRKRQLQDGIDKSGPFLAHWLRLAKQADDLQCDLFHSDFVQVSCVGSEGVRFDSKVL